MSVISVIQLLTLAGVCWLIYRQERIMASMQELTTELIALNDQVAKSKVEILAKIAELEAIIAAGGGTTPEVDAALAALKAQVQGIDDVVPDAPTP